jgi:anthranilate synthase component 1
VEKRLGKCPNPDPLGVPDILLMVSDAVVVFDNLAGKMHAIVLADPARTTPSNRARRLAGLLENCASRSPRAVAWTSAAARRPIRCSAPVSPR